MQKIMPKFLLLNGKNAFPDVTYEDFLIDIINGSSFFKSKCSIMEHYVLNAEQSHGEDDAYTSDYQLDFKLLVSDDVMRARNHNMPEIDYSMMDEGFVFTKTKEPVEEVPDETILLDIANCSIEELKNERFPSNAVRSVVKNIKKPKNLFMYYPYEFLDVTIKEYRLFLPRLLKVFDNLLMYRDELNLGKDTFFCIKVNEYFMIYEWFNGKMVYRDKVHEYLASNYMGLKAYSVY